MSGSVRAAGRSSERNSRHGSPGSPGSGEGAGSTPPARSPGPRRSRIPARPGEGNKGKIGSIEGLAALSLDALSSVAYGPEAIVVALVAAGTAALHLTFPIAVAIAILLAVLVVSYRQVIAVHPDGGGAYAVAKSDLTRPIALLAAASLIVDYVLTVAVSLAAGAASLVSVFPGLESHVVAVCLTLLVVLTAINLFGIAESARVLLLPTGLFIVGVLAVIAVGMLRGAHPVATVGRSDGTVHAAEAVGIVLVLKAFAAGCSAVTGIEAIANGVPTFKDPAVKRAQRTEVTLGALLGVMLIGLSYLIVHWHLRPRGGVTILAQLTAGSFGTGWPYDVTNLAVTLALALAANTSFGGLPVLMSLLAKDNRLPHVFALRSERPVYRYGVVSLALLAAVLLVAVKADTQRLIPLYAIGVFIGFTISQTGLVRHWRRERPRGWAGRAALNGFGAVLTAVAAIVFLVSKFTGGAWIVVLLIPSLMLLFARIESYYDAVGRELGLDTLPPRPRPRETGTDHETGTDRETGTDHETGTDRDTGTASDTGTHGDLPPDGRRPVVLVPSAAVSRLTEFALSTALSLVPAADVVALAAVTDPDQTDALQQRWDDWNPGITLTVLPEHNRSLVEPVLEYVDQACRKGRVVIVLIVEIQPRHRRQEILHNHRGLILTTALRYRSDAVVATLPFRLHT